MLSELGQACLREAQPWPRPTTHFSGGHHFQDNRAKSDGAFGNKTNRKLFCVCTENKSFLTKNAAVNFQDGRPVIFSVDFSS